MVLYCSCFSWLLYDYMQSFLKRKSCLHFAFENSWWHFWLKDGSSVLYSLYASFLPKEFLCQPVPESRNNWIYVPYYNSLLCSMCFIWNHYNNMPKFFKCKMPLAFFVCKCVHIINFMCTTFNIAFLTVFITQIHLFVLPDTIKKVPNNTN